MFHLFPKKINAQTVLSVWESKCKEAKAAVGSFVSQEFLQSLKIFQEYHLVNNKRTTISPQLLLCELACFFLDTKEQVEKYRKLYEFIDDCSKISDHYTNISSGSTAEGVDIPGGDYDLMTILENITVDIDGSEVHKGPILLYNTENSYPGYAHLKISKSKYSDDVFRHWGETSTWGTLISNKRFKNYFIERYRDDDTKIHGPCISTNNDSVGNLFCFRSLSWPPVAKQWIQRARLKEWQSNQIVSDVINEGVLFVPICSKFGGTEDYLLEWRISFSLAEKDN